MYFSERRKYPECKVKDKGGDLLPYFSVGRIKPLIFLFVFVLTLSSEN